MRVARWVFLTAGIVGLLMAVALLYAVSVDGHGVLPDVPSAGLFFYGFVIQHVCWQVLYIVLARDPARYRLMMIPAFFAEASTPLYPAWLYLYGFTFWVALVVIDLVLAALFGVAFWLTRREAERGAA
jgi:hypothetical protein